MLTIVDLTRARGSFIACLPLVFSPDGAEKVVLMMLANQEGPLVLKHEHQNEMNMTYESWEAAVVDIDARLRTVTETQLAFAGEHRPLIADLPFIVAAAVLRQLNHQDLDVSVRPPSSSRLLALEETWATAFGDDCDLPSPIDTGEQVSAWIEVAFLTIRRAALAELKLRKGDLVKQKWRDRVYEVRSIASDGRIYFTGGKGRRAWPDYLTVLERFSERPSKKSALRRSAENDASNFTKRESWSESRHAQLVEFCVPRDADLKSALEEAVEILESAGDERPMQEVFARHPVLLTSLLRGGHGRYLWDRPRFADDYIPDFLIADVDSGGIHYKLVELESPTEQIFLKDGSFAKNSRKGIEQIQEWRYWLESNIAFARTPVASNGAGFIDIESTPPGLMIIGRQQDLTVESEEKRKQALNQNGIEIRTYDGILESIRSQLR